MSVKQYEIPATIYASQIAWTARRIIDDPAFNHRQWSLWQADTLAKLATMIREGYAAETPQRLVTTRGTRRSVSTYDRILETKKLLRKERDALAEQPDSRALQAGIESLVKVLRQLEGAERKKR